MYLECMISLCLVVSLSLRGCTRSWFRIIRQDLLYSLKLVLVASTHQGLAISPCSDADVRRNARGTLSMYCSMASMNGV
jgi:hypothetical protein